MSKKVNIRVEIMTRNGNTILVEEITRVPHTRDGWQFVKYRGEELGYEVKAYRPGTEKPSHGRAPILATWYFKMFKDVESELLDAQDREFTALLLHAGVDIGSPEGEALKSMYRHATEHGLHAESPRATALLGK